MRSHWLTALFLVSACSATDLAPRPDAGPPPAVDAGPHSPPDSGPVAPPDAGPALDAGPAPVDAGPPHADAGPTDAGPADAGPPDAGPLDAGPADAGPGHCELVNNACIHTGDPTTFCGELWGTEVDPVLLCMVNPHKVFACRLAGLSGYACFDEEYCYQAPYGDGGAAFAYLPNDCVPAPSNEGCADSLSEEINRAWDSLPDCASVYPAPDDAGPGRCDIVGDTCVHSGGEPPGCTEDYSGFTLDLARGCHLPGKEYACEAGGGRPSAGDFTWYQFSDGDGGISLYVNADFPWLIPVAGAVVADPATVDAYVAQWGTSWNIPTCPP
jgi:hypothetical protein